MTAAAQAPPLLALRNAAREYGGDGQPRVTALDGVDLEVRPGEFIAVVGPSGSGKSTLLHLLGVLDLPTSGEVMVEGRETRALKDVERTLIRRRRIGFVFQHHNLLPMLTAVENVALPLYLDGMRRNVADDQARELLVRFGLSERVRHCPPTLSGGECQRIAVARALAPGPGVILADEPTGNLDRASGDTVLSLLGQLVSRDQVAVVMVTHDPVAASLAHRTIELVDGRVVRDGPDPSAS